MTERCPFAVLDWDWREAGYIVFRILPDGRRDVVYSSEGREKGYLFFHDGTMAISAMETANRTGGGPFMVDNATMEQAREASKKNPQLSGVWVIDKEAGKHFVCTK